MLRDARALPPAELAKLTAALLEETSGLTEAEETAVGRRGLASWTESTCGEDWSAYYPPVLRNKRGKPG